MKYAALIVAIPIGLAILVFGFVTFTIASSTQYDQAKLGGPGHGAVFGVTRDWLFSFGSLSITRGKHRTGAVLNAAQWNCLTATWNRAKTGKEALPCPTKAAAPLPAFATAKPTLRITVLNGNNCTGYDVPTSEIGGVDQALLQVRDHMRGQQFTTPGKSRGLATGLRMGVLFFWQWIHPTTYLPVRDGC